MQGFPLGRQVDLRAAADQSLDLKPGEQPAGGACSGAQEGLVLVAELQTSGCGRTGRRWASRPRCALTFSALLRPGGVPAGLLGWMPLLAGVAVVSALQETAGLDPG